jgi:hypothetical protein
MRRPHWSLALLPIADVAALWTFTASSFVYTR